MVSIHAPARGATYKAHKKYLFEEVSIHAPARGATRVELSGATGRAKFQFTRPRGARPMPFSFALSVLLMFQFTRPRGARPPRSIPCETRSCFNSRAREGRDYSAHDNAVLQPAFQFTRPRGARRLVSDPQPQQTRFQFTRPRGARPSVYVVFVSCVWFQFTRPRGARLVGGLRRRQAEDVSIHAPARGATNVHFITSRFRNCFNSRAREGRDERRARNREAGACFNSRAREGRDGSSMASAKIPDGFNSRAREGRDRLAAVSVIAVRSFNSRAREGRDDAASEVF